MTLLQESAMYASVPLQSPQAVVLEQLAHDRLLRILELEAEVKRLRQERTDR